MTSGVARVLSSVRYLLADFIGENRGEPPCLPEGLSASAAVMVSEGIHLLMDYHGASYAQLYVDRVRRFMGRPEVDEAMLGEIARLMMLRMSYEDPIRIAQLKLAELHVIGKDTDPHSTDDVKKFQLDQLIGTLPAAVGMPVLDALEWLGWTRKLVPVRFSIRSVWGVRRLKVYALLRRWRRLSVRYAEERVWVERWLHMINRSLAKQPEAAGELIQTATMIRGLGPEYRQSMADWNAVIDGLAKPTFDGALPLSDLAGAIAKARAAAMPDPRQVALKRVIAEIRAGALSASSSVAAE